MDGGSRAAIALAATIFTLLSASALAAPFAYVPNSGDGTVSVIDTGFDTVVGTIPVGESPIPVAVNPAGTRVYVGNADTVSVIDATQNSVIATVPVPHSPTGVVVSPDGTKVYVAGWESSSVTVIDTASNTVSTSFPAGFRPNAIALSPRSARAYLTNSLESGERRPCDSSALFFCDVTMSVLDIENESEILRFKVGDRLTGLAVDPSQPRIYVANEVPPYLSDPPGVVSVIDERDFQIISRVTVGSAPEALVLNPSARRLYVSVARAVAVVDADELKTTASIPIEGRPMGIDVHPAGTRVYVAAVESDTVSVIDTARHTVVDIIHVGRGPIAFGRFVGPEQVPFTPVATPTASASPTPAPPNRCVADCNADGVVTVQEVVLAVDIALGARDISDCPSADAGRDGSVAIDDLIRAVNAIIEGCASPP